MLKRALLISLLLLFAGALVWGNRIVASSVDQQLAPLLSRELGLPVTIAPVKANLLTLGVSTPLLQMGDGPNPAVLAHDVKVNLSWRSLLRGEVRLLTAQGSMVTLDIARWPDVADDDDDYTFLDPWLPTGLKVKQLQYTLDNGEVLPLRSLSWRRQLDGSSNLGATYLSQGKRIKIETKLASLQQLLTVTELRYTGSARVLERKGSDLEFDLHIAPAQDAAYQLELITKAAATQAKTTALGTAAWEFPTSSETGIDSLQLKPLVTLLNNYFGDAEDEGSLLAQSVPSLWLPVHQGKLNIAELTQESRVLENLNVTFGSAPGKLSIDSLTASGSHGDLQTQASLTIDKQQWLLSVDADLTARSDNESLAAQYLNADWFWQAGKLKLKSAGSTWGTLLYSTNGQVSLQGFRQGSKPTPVAIKADVAGAAEKGLQLTGLTATLDTGTITGSVGLAPGELPRLDLDLRGEKLDLGFLDEGEDNRDQAGVTVPEYLEIAGTVELHANINLTEVALPGLNLATLDINWNRIPGKTTMNARARARDGSAIDVKLIADSAANQPTDVQLDIDLEKVRLQQLFTGEAGLLGSRTTGSLKLSSKGNSAVEIFAAMHGSAKLGVEIRTDDDWQRQPKPNEEIDLSGNAALVVQDSRILGAKIEELQLSNSRQDISGTLSMIAGQKPWFNAELVANSLAVSPLLDSISALDVQEQDSSDPLVWLKDLGAIELSLRADKLELMQIPMEQAYIQLSSGADSFEINHMDFELHDGKVQSQASIKWQDSKAQLSAAGEITNLNLDEFVLPAANGKPVPLSGKVKLASTGETVDEVIAQLSGTVLLANSATGQIALKDQRKLDIELSKLDNGVRGGINTLQFGESNLRGEVLFYNTLPAQLDITLQGGSISLTPWENAAAEAASQPSKSTDESVIEDAAKASARAIQSILTAPGRLLTSDDTKTTGKKYFSSEIFDLGFMQHYDVNFKGTLDAINSKAFVARELQMDGSIKAGQLSLQGASRYFNGGSAELKLDYQSAVAPYAADLTATLKGVRRHPEGPGTTNNIYFDLSSHGQSQAELAAHLNGLAYYESGKGPLDPRAAPLLTSDVAMGLVRALIPTAKKTQPELQCAITLANFKEGMGITPYGYAAQTRTANLVGRVALDLAKEHITLKFDSRSREGVGISLSSVFSNTIQIKGPLTDPSVVPDTGSLLWRGWAAFMTGGLSVIGESVLKRTLSSPHPCKDIQDSIRKDICGKDLPGASSPLLCPTG